MGVRVALVDLIINIEHVIGELDCIAASIDFLCRDDIGLFFVDYVKDLLAETSKP
jgi:hypothetical protein